MNRIIVYSLVSFLGGVGVASLTSFSLSALLFLLLMYLSFGFVLVVRKKFGKEKERYKDIFKILLFVCCFFLGALRFFYTEYVLDTQILYRFTETKVSLIGEVLSEQVKNDKKRIVLRVHNLESGKEITKIPKEKVLVFTSQFSPVVYGDELLLSGTLNTVDDKTTRELDFDYKNYLRKDGVNFQMFSPEIQVVGREGGNSLFKFLFSLKDTFVSNIERYTGEPSSSLASGMVIAGKGGLPKELEEDFIRVGLIHIVVLSGYNISLIISFVLFSLGSLRPKIRTLIIITFVLLFVLMAGASAPLVRASIMASIVLFGKLAHRSINQNRVLLLSASIMVLHNPYILMFDPSFQLSFLATFAIINIAPWVKEKITFITEKFFLREVLSQTLAVEVLVAPFLLFKIGTFSLVAPLANILVLPLVPFVMLGSIVIGIFGGIPLVGTIFGFLTEVLIAIILWLVEFFASLPFASF